MRLSEEHRQLLRSLACGSTLKVHRDMHGAKVYKLHPLNETPAEEIPAKTVNHLRKYGLIDSNMKFPAAVFLLTDKGAAVTARLIKASFSPLRPRNFYR